jgi:hypothetical protein
MEVEARFRAAATVDRYRMARLQRVRALQRLIADTSSAGGVFAGCDLWRRVGRQSS